MRLDEKTSVMEFKKNALRGRDLSK